MICDPCREGGRTLTFVKRAGILPPYLDNAREDAEARHAKCEAPQTCGCHHSVSLDAINPEAK